MFGSLDWNQDNLLDYQSINSTIYLNNKRSHHHHHHHRNNHNNYSSQHHTNTPRNHHHDDKDSNNDDDIDEDDSKSASIQYEHDAIVGMRPMRDRYLLITLSKMSAPIMQMFPELEGFTGMMMITMMMMMITMM
jgi:hypothetical protein